MFTSYPFLSLFVLLAVLLLATEIGHRLGRRVGIDSSHGVPADLAGALLGMLGLLLGFTVSMAETRFDARKQLVVEEANAIGTAMLRTSLLPAPLDAQSHAVFVKYLEGRVLWGEMAGDDVRQGVQARLDAELQERLWVLAMAASAQRPSPITATYVTALNEVIDLEAERSQVRANRIPGTVLYLLAVFALISCFGLSMSQGHSGRRSIALPGLAIATWLVFLLIVDLDLPRRGWIQVSQEPMVLLRESVRPQGQPAGRI